MRIGFLCCSLILTLVVSAQAVRRKHLVMSVAGGVGVMNLFSDREDIGVEGLGSGAMRAALGYAIADRWSLGVHYDRIGSAWHNGGVDRLHLTTYLLGFTYRPWIGERYAVEAELGIGAMNAALFPEGSRLPYTTTGSVVNVSVRYQYMYSHTIGVFTALDHGSSSSGELVVDGGLVNTDGTRTRIQWNSTRLTAGMLVRF